jgi:hypothetical protein
MFRRAAAIVAVVSAAGLGACSDAGHTARAAPTSTTFARGVELASDQGRPDAEQMRALRRLVSPAGSVTDPVMHGAGATHGESMPMMHGESMPTTEPTPELEPQLQIARRAASSLLTLSRLSDAGYFLGSYYSAGVGTHYIDWRLVGATFDPARPAMLLVDSTPTHSLRLAGFSYWVRSSGPPDGFAGDSDVWHRHRGLCFFDAIMVRENVRSSADCDGDWIDGGDLWMLHAWVVPGYENREGVFAPLNHKLCPPRNGVDAARCDF